MKAALFCLCLASACGPSAAAARATTAWRVIDLTQTLTTEMPVFPGGQPPAVETLGTVEKDGYFIQKLTLGEHTGTHVDAAAHFVSGQTTVEKIPVDWLVRQAAVVDISARVAGDPDAMLEPGDLKAWERRHGRLGQGACVLVRSGWSVRWPDEKLYRNTDARGAMHFPGVSVAASRYLRERGVKCLGIDTLSTDPGLSKTFDQHKQFLAGGGFHLENLTNLDALPPAGATIVVGVLPLSGGSGAPARVLALIPR